MIGTFNFLKVSSVLALVLVILVIFSEFGDLVKDLVFDFAIFSILEGTFHRLGLFHVSECEWSLFALLIMFLALMHALVSHVTFVPGGCQHRFEASLCFESFALVVVDLDGVVEMMFWLL